MKTLYQQDLNLRFAYRKSVWEYLSLMLTKLIEFVVICAVTAPLWVYLIACIWR